MYESDRSSTAGAVERAKTLPHKLHIHLLHCLSDNNPRV